MSRPIEKYGWEYTGTYNNDNELEECFETSLGHEIRIDNEGNILFLSEEAGFDFEVLQAIYETAKQIKEENNPSNILEKDLLFEEETDGKVNIELQRKKVEEEIKRYEENHKEDYEEYKKVGYRELEKEEISKKSCWQCSHFRGGYIGAGCWCSQEKCDYKENDDVLIPQ